MSGSESYSRHQPADMSELLKAARVYDDDMDTASLGSGIGDTDAESLASASVGGSRSHTGSELLVDTASPTQSPFAECAAPASSSHLRTRDHMPSSACADQSSSAASDSESGGFLRPGVDLNVRILYCI